MPVTCYICGRDFGTKSISIHIPNCQKRWDHEQKKLPKAQRRPIPEAPTNFDKIISGEISAPRDLQAYNEQAFNDFNTKALEECPNCGRTFLPKPLEIHRRSCHSKTKSQPAPRKPRPSKERPSQRSPRPTANSGLEHASIESTESTGPSREEIISILKNDPAFDSPEIRGELLKFVQQLVLNGH